jgi:hippurate hydrolase
MTDENSGPPAASQDQAVTALGLDLQRLQSVRRDLHAHPETAYEEARTASIVAAELQAAGVDEIHQGIAVTGVVGVVRGRPGPRAIGLRADMDALPITETGDRPWRSRIAGKMHGCGHDGHTTMLLGAARLLARQRDFDGTVYLIFQPAEEGEGGGRRMVEEGLFRRFPMEAVYGMHNIPGMPAGHLAVMPGPMMASFDLIDIHIQGIGGHAAFPHRAADPLLAGARLVTALQDVVSRRVDPLDSAVLSITRFQSGDTHNVIPASATLSGTVRVLQAPVREAVEAEVRRICAGIGQACGVTITVDYQRRYPPTVNHREPARIAAAAARRFAGADRVSTDLAPVMAAEDFAFMLEACPGAYVWIGNGTGSQGGCMVHHPEYDFNDDILETGAGFWVALVHETLGADGAADPTRSLS